MQSLSLRSEKPLNPDKFFPWVQDLVATEGKDILRCKGILSFKDDPERFVFQGVHMILDGDHQRPWKADEKRAPAASSSSAATCRRKKSARGLRAAWLNPSPERGGWRAISAFTRVFDALWRAGWGSSP